MAIVGHVGDSNWYRAFDCALFAPEKLEKGFALAGLVWLETSGFQGRELKYRVARGVDESWATSLLQAAQRKALSKFGHIGRAELERQIGELTLFN